MKNQELQGLYPIDNFKKADILLRHLKSIESEARFDEAKEYILEIIEDLTIKAYFKEEASNLKMLLLEKECLAYFEIHQKNPRTKKINNEENINTSKNKKGSLKYDLESLVGKQINEVAEISKIPKKFLLNIISKGDQRVSLLSRFTNDHLQRNGKELYKYWHESSTKKDDPKPDYNNLLNDLKGRSIEDVAIVCNLTSRIIAVLLAHKGKRVRSTTIFNEAHLRLIKPFLENALKTSKKQVTDPIFSKKKLEPSVSQNSKDGYLKIIYTPHPKY